MEQPWPILKRARLTLSKAAVSTVNKHKKQNLQGEAADLQTCTKIDKMLTNHIRVECTSCGVCVIVVGPSFRGCSTEPTARAKM